MSTYKKVLCAAVCAGLVAGVAHSKALKVRQLTPAGPGTTLNPEADGFAIINYHDSTAAEAEIQVAITGFEPNTTYGVQVFPGVTDPMGITTNAAGNGSWHGGTPNSLITQVNIIVRIFVWDGNPATVSEVSFDELRAIGCLSGNCPSGVTCAAAADCDDSFDCTRDTCEGGFCFRADRGDECDDGNACTVDSCEDVNPGDGVFACFNAPIFGCTP